MSEQGGPLGVTDAIAAISAIDPIGAPDPIDAFQASDPIHAICATDPSASTDEADEADETEEMAATDATAAQTAATAAAGREHHPSAEALWRFVDGELPAGEMRLVLRHLLRGCRGCRERAREVWNITRPPAAEPMAQPAAESPFALALLPAPVVNLEPAGASVELVPAAEAPGGPGLAAATAASGTASHCGPISSAPSAPAAPSENAAYDKVLDRVFSRINVEEAAVEVARRRAEGLFEELTQHPAARQQMLVQNSVRFCDRSLCERLLTASHEEGFRSPVRSLDLARVAVAVVERLVDGPLAGRPSAAGLALAPTAEQLAGLRARAWAQLGNALRIGSDHEGAAKAFGSVDSLLAANPRLGLIDKARVLDLKASFCRDRRRFAEAVRLLDRVIVIYRRLGQSDLMGRALTQKATVLADSGDVKGSLVLMRRALDLIDPQEDPRWFLILRHNLIATLVEDGQAREAFALLFHTRPLYLKMGDRMNLLRLRWLEGHVAQGLQRLEQAEAAYREVRDAFVELGIEYDAALVSLDLAGVFARQGRTGEMGRLAQEMLFFFETRQIHREAMAAFLVFCNAARMEQAGLGLVQQVAAFLKQARHTPDLCFAPPPAPAAPLAP